MKLLSINVAQTQLVEYRGDTVSTAIYKQPVAGPVEVHSLGIAGDDQADKSVHGGVDKAVYAYAEESYQWWREQLRDREFLPGQFGENLTIAGLPDNAVQVGDRYRIGTALFEVSQPRQPCMKLGIKMGDATFVKQFHQAGRPGFYLRVLESGTMTPGDDVETVHKAVNSMSIASLYQLRFDAAASGKRLQSAAQLPGLSNAWRVELQKLAASKSGD